MACTVPYARDGVEVETMNGNCFKGKFKDVEIGILYKYLLNCHCSIPPVVRFRPKLPMNIYIDSDQLSAKNQYVLQ